MHGISYGRACIHLVYNYVSQFLDFVEFVQLVQSHFVIFLLLLYFQMSLLDFGASRDFSRRFTDDYIRVIKAATEADRQAIKEGSIKLGFLTGYETKVRRQGREVLNKSYCMQYGFASNLKCGCI